MSVAAIGTGPFPDPAVRRGRVDDSPATTMTGGPERRPQEDFGVGAGQLGSISSDGFSLEVAGPSESSRSVGDVGASVRTDSWDSDVGSVRGLTDALSSPEAAVIVWAWRPTGVRSNSSGVKSWVNKIHKPQMTVSTARTSSTTMGIRKLGMFMTAFRRPAEPPHT